MFNKKDNLIIFVLCLTVISLSVLIMLKNPADIRIVENKNISIDKNVNTNQNTNQAVNQNINTNQNQNTNQTVNQNINTNKPVATIIDGVDVSDWNIYKNEEYGYSIRYPKDWDIKEVFGVSKTGASFMKDNSRIVVDRGAIVEEFLDKPFDEYIYIAGSGIQNHESLNSIKKIIINSGIKGYRITWNVSHGSSPDTISSEMIYFDAKKKGFYKHTKTIRIIAEFLETNEYKEIFNIIIKTFNYIK